MIKISYTKLDKINNIIFAGFVPDGELDVVYKNANLYIFPSLYEGFGVPPLEAMTKKVPVLSSDHACMKEILGEGASYFHAVDKNSISGSIIDLIDDEEEKNKLKNKGLEIIKKFSWKKMAEETLVLYKSHANHNAASPKSSYWRSRIKNDKKNR
jgi:glycosyltransferase involved in cell wall biosynthesis